MKRPRPEDPELFATLPDPPLPATPAAPASEPCATCTAADCAVAEDDMPADDRLDTLFERLARSEFRSRFRLRPADRSYVGRKGLETIRRHAADFVRTRLAPALPPNDGRQTPMRGHPVFIAQHATGCCCRGCLAKWHGIPAGRPLTEPEQQYVVRVLMAWIVRQMGQ